MSFFFEYFHLNPNSSHVNFQYLRACQIFGVFGYRAVIKLENELSSEAVDRSENPSIAFDGSALRLGCCAQFGLEDVEKNLVHFW